MGKPQMKKKITLNEQAKQPVKKLIHMAAIYFDEADGVNKIKMWDTAFELYPQDTLDLHVVVKSEDLNGEVFKA